MATEVKTVFVLKTVKLGFYVNMTKIDEKWVLVKLWDTPKFATQFTDKKDAYDMASIALIASKGENDYQLSDADHGGVDIDIAVGDGFVVEEMIVFDE